MDIRDNIASRRAIKAALDNIDCQMARIADATRSINFFRSEIARIEADLQGITQPICTTCGE